MMIKTICNGEIIPRYYGVAWYDFYQDKVVCLPIPFNFFARHINYFYSWLRVGNVKITENPRIAYIQGYEKGFKDAAKYVSEQLFK